MPKTVILGAARTPFGKMGGALSTLDATELGGIAIKAALERSEVAPDQVQHVVFGQVLQAGQGQIPSRQAQIKGGIPKEVSSETINKVCASGIRAAGVIDQAVRAGDLDVARRLPVWLQTVGYLFCIYSIILFGVFRGAAFIYFQF
jgi:acetyl-CoA C-acetyltransferase